MERYIALQCDSHKTKRAIRFSLVGISVKLHTRPIGTAVQVMGILYPKDLKLIRADDLAEIDAFLSGVVTLMHFIMQENFQFSSENVHTHFSGAPLTALVRYIQTFFPSISILWVLHLSGYQPWFSPGEKYLRQNSTITFLKAKRHTITKCEFRAGV